METNYFYFTHFLLLLTVRGGIHELDNIIVDLDVFLVTNDLII